MLVYISYDWQDFKDARSPIGKYKKLVSELEGKGWTVVNTTFSKKRNSPYREFGFKDLSEQGIERADALYVYAPSVKRRIVNAEIQTAKRLNKPIYGLPLSPEDKAYLEWVESECELTMPYLSNKHGLDTEKMIAHFLTQWKQSKVDNIYKHWTTDELDDRRIILDHDKERAKRHLAKNRTRDRRLYQWNDNAPSGT